MKRVREFTTIDVLKFIFALLIVALHAGVMDANASYIGWMVSSTLYRLAVPFFLTVSGFFLADKLFAAGRGNVEQCKSTLKQYCGRLVPPLIFFAVVGLLFDIVELFFDGRDIPYILAYIFRSFFYPLNSMWYLLASIIGAVILTNIWLRVRKWKKAFLIYGCIGYVIVLLCNNYYFIIQGTILEKIVYYYSRVFVSARNGVFLAPVFMGLGFFLRDETIWSWLSNHKRIVVCAFIVSIGLLIFEANILYGKASFDDRSMFLTYALLIPSLVTLALTYNIQFKLPYKTLRRLSTSIYYLQAMIIRNVLYFCLPEALLGGWYSLTVLILTLIMAICISLVSYRSKNPKIHLLLG